MANQDKASEIREKIQQAIEKLGDAMAEWLDKQRPQNQPVPVPIDRPTQNRR